jgi:hypothetical protein
MAKTTGGSGAHLGILAADALRGTNRVETGDGRADFREASGTSVLPFKAQVLKHD